ncbi:MAG: SMI1/KNR4 family protein [Myxacorys californica WJT36-NPBG1]|jgi:hypothetical protein|nr:SMI1/KNR4 family protein [Myxacorys californica WJT36-NPBG1]
MIEDWKKEIVVMVYVKQVLHDEDKSYFWPWHLPEVAATGAQLEEVEKHLGHALDLRYRLFLQHANGWQGFYQDVDLFGTSDLLGGGKMARALMFLDTIDDVLRESNLSKDELLPIAVSNTDIDFFVITRPNSVSPGMVIWFAGGEIERFSSFDEYFLCMVDHNRHMLTLAKQEE